MLHHPLNQQIKGKNKGIFQSIANTFTTMSTKTLPGKKENRLQRENGGVLTSLMRTINKGENKNSKQFIHSKTTSKLIANP